MRYIIDPTLGEEGIAALVEKFKAMVEAEGTPILINEKILENFKGTNQGIKKRNVN